MDSNTLNISIIKITYSKTYNRWLINLNLPIDVLTHIKYIIMARGNFYFDQNLYYIEVTKYYLPEEFAAKD